ncbi:MAG: adenosylcobinamide amidohydrolase [Candidatus Methanodesulfokora washburnensis]|jgi:adenosylcobinamide amidohydrolase
MPSLLEEISYVKENKALIVKLAVDHFFLSTMPYQPTSARTIIFKQVPKDFQEINLREFYGRIRSELDAANSIVFLTAANVENYIYSKIDEPEIHILITMGLRPPTCPGVKELFRPLSSTINIAVIVDRGLTKSAIIDLIRVVAEAKTLAAVELLLRCDYRSSGTVTDAIAVGRPLSLDESVLFAGMSTDIGNKVAYSIYSSIVKEGLRRLSLDDFIINTLGIQLEELLKIIAKSYNVIFNLNIDEKILVENATIIINYLFKDRNIINFLITARELDLRTAIGSIPAYGNVRTSPAEEYLSIGLAAYSVGLKSIPIISQLRKIEELGIIRINSPQFEKEAALGIIGSALLLLHEALSGK